MMYCQIQKKYMMYYSYSATTVTVKVTNRITGKLEYIPRKLVVGQSAARKKTESYSKHKI